ncbi:MAG: hypothetical protein AAF654_13060 [Myxococcota bacterium]
MDGHEKYQRKLISTDDALRMVQSNHEVVSALAASEASGDALSLVDEWLSRPNVETIAPTNRHSRILQELLMRLISLRMRTWLLSQSNTEQTSTQLTLISHGFLGSIG